MRIVHISDLHFVDGDGLRRIEQPKMGPIGNGPLLRAFDGLRACLSGADFVVVSGDATDSGTREQWRSFLKVFESLPGLSRKTVLAPGNHDLNQVLKQPDTPDFAQRGVRSALFIGTHEALRLGSVEPLDQDGSRRDVDDIFPLVRVEITETGLQVAFVTINTVAPSTNIAGNAVGRFVAGQLPPLVQGLQGDGYLVVIIGHHHPLAHFDSKAPPRTLLKKLCGVMQGIGMEAIDSTRFLDRLEAVISGPVLYLHGHKHVFRVHDSKTTGLRICGAPSMLFGDESTNNPNCIAVQHEVSRHGGRWVFNSVPVFA